MDLISCSLDSVLENCNTFQEYRHLLRALGEHLHHYWQICGVVDPRTGSGVRNFWAEFGYFTNKWTEEPSQEPKYMKKRLMKTNQWMQCGTNMLVKTLMFALLKTLFVFVFNIDVL